MKLGLSSLPSSLLLFNWPQKALAQDTSGVLVETQHPQDIPTWTPFSRLLRILGTLEPVCDDDEATRYEIEIQPTTQMIGPDEVPIWSYNGATPGPLIRQTLDKTSVVRFINSLSVSDVGEEVPVSIHLHGMASLPEYDGFADDLIYPPGWDEDSDGQYKDYIYPNDRAATIWYHDHAVHHTRRNVAMGMAGMYIVHDPQVEDELNLPGNPYHDELQYDVPLILQSHPYAIYETEDVFPEPLPDDATYTSSEYGSFVLVNGDLQPFLDVYKRKYRFRLLNATDLKELVLRIGARRPNFRGAERFDVIASDGGLRLEPLSVFGIRITPGERYEIVVDFSPYEVGDDVFLVLENSAGDYSELLQFNIVGPPASPDNSDVPCPLSAEEQPPALEDYEPDTNLVFNLAPIPAPCEPDRKLLFNFSSAPRQSDECTDDIWAIGVYNGTNTDYHYWKEEWPDRRVANPPLGQQEDGDPPQVWRMFNPSPGNHPVHVHLIDTFLIQRYSIDIDDDQEGLTEIEKEPYETGWKDVFLLPAGQAMDIGGFFGPHEGRYMMHCHNLAHEDNDMMVEFQVGGPDDTEPPPGGGQQSQGDIEPLCDVPADVYDRARINKFNTRVYGDRQRAFQKLKQRLQEWRRRRRNRS
ncbi:MAG: multicopper oxidase family protein [Symploca sp. SIO3E6]|nr:multicopper oxidase family protein [Caldora sp. SIO3E6]